MPDALKLYSVAEVAAAARVSEQTIRRRLIEGLADGTKVGRDWVFTESQRDYLVKTVRTRRPKR